MIEERATVLRRVIKGADKSFALFAQGTVVILMGDDRSEARAKRVLKKELGPAQVGGPKGDFSVMALPEDLGWVISYDHPDVFTLVLADEMGAASPDHLIGLLARSRRDQDVEELGLALLERVGS